VRASILRTEFQTGSGLLIRPSSLNFVCTEKDCQVNLTLRTAMEAARLFTAKALMPLGENAAMAMAILENFMVDY
jgi:hypothetical protein